MAENAHMVRQDHRSELECRTRDLELASFSLSQLIYPLIGPTHAAWDNRSGRAAVSTLGGAIGAESHFPSRW